MKGHLYRVTLEHLEDAPGSPVTREPLSFEVRNHDDIFGIIEKLKQKSDLGIEETEAFAVGLKLFGEVMLTHRDNPLFKPLEPHFLEFMKALKKS